MSTKCPECGFTIIKNPKPLKVLKMLRVRKNNNENEKYPLLVADFECEDCENTIHLKWNDLDKDVDVKTCSECGGKLKASVFLGIMKGFNLESYCFSCYGKLNSGKFGFQK